MKLNNFWKTSILIICVLSANKCIAQNYSWVYFTDKCSDSLDYFSNPVCDNYLDQLKELKIEIVGTSKWLNAACVKPSIQLQHIDTLNCVSYCEPLQKYKAVEATTNEAYSYGRSDIPMQMLNLDAYHQKGFTGQNVTIAVFDGGFAQVDSMEILSSLWQRDQIIASRDFVTNDTLTWDQSAHGMQVLSIIGINYPDSMVGAAPDASFVLARTEDVRSEKHIEEYNWLRAMEWADSVGVDIIHSSLGYSLFDSLEGNYTYQDMDGKSTLITIAAQKAASMGIFITNSAGNSGNDPWYYITAPCDGKDVLCVGAVDSFEIITPFSSRGPSADGRVKPDVCAMGANITVPRENGILRTGSGTSFSGPIIAGMVACLMQAHPMRSNSEIFNAIIQSADRYTRADSLYGYGIPDLLIADSLLQKMSLGIHEPKPALDFDLYPNPSRGTIKVRTHPGSTYTLYGPAGRVLTKGSCNNWINFIDLTAYAAGNYYLEIQKDSGSVTKPIQIQ